MSDIRAGDAVVCIDDSPCLCCGCAIGVAFGSVHRVLWARLDINKPTGIEVLAIGLVSLPDSPRHPSRRGVNAARFRKIDAPQTSVSERIKKCRPIKVREVA